MEESNILELCSACAKSYEEIFRVLKTTGADQKVNCQQCGRRRYGGKYRLERKARK